MRKLAIACAALLAASLGFAQQDHGHEHQPLDEKTEKLVRGSLPRCPDLKFSGAPFGARMPAGMTSLVVEAQSSRPACNGQYLAVTTANGSFYLGMPWILEGVEGASLEEKLKSFAWTRMQENMTAVVDRQRTRDGLYRVTLFETTERGRVPLTGVIDPEGRVFFMGDFRPASADVAAARVKAFESVVANAPARGADQPAVTVVEFSDFQCPSCKFASAYLDPVLEKYGDRVRYVRYDLPLMSSHPWAFAASVAGRAIYKQKPELFWDYKKQVYSNQDKLSAFTFDDFARGFAEDRDLDMAKYDADVNAAEIREEILKGIGTAFSNEIRATPTFMVNGVFVDAGDGKPLEEYIAGLLK
jgi:protein-disulfide isomerase